VIGKTATLELTPSQSETLHAPKQMGNLSLALRSIADFEGKPVSDEKQDKRGGINMVRFGVTTMSTSK